MGKYDIFLGKINFSNIVECLLKLLKKSGTLYTDACTHKLKYLIGLVKHNLSTFAKSTGDFVHIQDMHIIYLAEEQ